MTTEWRSLLERYDVGPADAEDRLVVYLELLERWSERHSLVRWRTPVELIERHVMDSLDGAAHLGSGRLVDIGSGAGLPGVPLLVTSPGTQGLLVEPRSKRWTFLRLVVRALELDCEVTRSRYQDLAIEADVTITSRALGAWDGLLGWAEGVLDERGRVLLWLGDDEAQRLGERSGWSVLSCALPSLGRGRLLLLRRPYDEDVSRET